MKFFLLTLSIVFGSGMLFAQADLLQHTQGRKTISLDGVWDYIVDPYDAGFLNGSGAEDLKGGFYKNQKPQKYVFTGKNWGNTERVEYDFDEAEKIKVPGDWNSQDPRLFFYEGAIWYRKVFNYAPAPGARQFVYLEAANYTAQVYLNGQKLGEHTGGFTPFQFEVTGKLLTGPNMIFVRVNNRRFKEGVPTLKTDWWNYGGLTRSVKIVETPATFVKDYFVQLAKGKKDEIEGWVQLDGADKTQPVQLNIPEAGVQKTLQPDANGYIAFHFKATVQNLWTPERPFLYKVALSIAADRVEDAIGFRTIETRGTEILLNGKPIFLKGVCIHEEAPYRSGRAYSEDDARTLLGWAKEMGCNFVRLAHYPHSENMIREADKMGLLVWSEIPVYWSIDWENPETYANAERQLTENLTRDKNRAAVAIWSVANETPEKPARMTFLKNLLAKGRSIDPTRLMSCALATSPVDTANFAIRDSIGNYVDVLACNEYVGWYILPAEKAKDLKWRSEFNKPLIMTEFGGEAIAGLHGRSDEIWTEEYVDRIYQNQLAMFDQLPFLRGTCPWLLMDFRSPTRLLARKQDYYNRKGLISDKGIKKKSFYTMRDWYLKK